MGKWVTRSIGSLGRVVTGKTPSTAVSSNFGGAFPFITIPDLDGRAFIDRCSRTLSEQGADALRTCLLPAGAVMMSCIATIGRCGITTRPSFTNQQINSVIPNAEADSRFLYYVFTQLGNELESAGGGGSVYTNVSKSRFSDIKIEIPQELDEQRAIAHILGTLDEKIELNRQMNETLEAMARALFKSWFVDFDPVRAKAEGRAPCLPRPLADLFPSRLVDSELGELPLGWQVKVLSDMTELVLGGDWGKDEPTGEFTSPVRCIRGADIPDLQAGGTGKMPIRYLKESSLAKRQLADGDLVVEISGGSPTQSTGRPVLVSDHLLRRLDAPLVCSNFCRLLKPRESSYSKFLYLWLRTLYSNDEFLQFENGTTSIKNFAFTLFSSTYNLCIPITEVLIEFEALVAAFFAKQQLVAAERDSLTALRDTLLPKLISGNLRVKGAEQLIEMVS